MKHGWNILAATVTIGMALLTACGSKGGGSSTASTPAACSYDSNGNCVAGVGGTGYIGDGNWSGRLMINNMTSFQQFAYENGLCYGQDCAYMSGYLNVQLYLQTGGCLPGPGTFTLQTFSQGYQNRQPFTQRADAYINQAGNGFLLNYTSQNLYNTTAYTPGAPQQTTVGTLQINTQFTDGNHAGLNVQLVYRGVQIASGSAVGTPSYNAQMAANGAQYCASGAYNGYGYNNGYTNINYGNGYYYGNGGYNTGYYYGGYYVPYRARH